ncbi:hypothetical protein [Nonomuraea aridisoli]|uniref:LamG domain-containing protein n=1 Tax=Nonomuraea aridisoli TaxID=2070368 RepID=A0A2W2E0J1_9ACTN|nr:hypothetical protein [Nonomuraea aridisoli]PZG16203.1 hypothetical protein C1J01_21820 [Nonomuraea aridisoli]
MNTSKLLAGRLSGLIVVGAVTLMAAPQSAYGDAEPVQADSGTTEGQTGLPGLPGLLSGSRWGIIGRNTLGGPNAVLREGPYGRTGTAFAATQAPPYGQGSLGIIVGSGNDKIAFGNETIFAGDRLSSIRTLRYWVFAGVDSLAGVSLPNITIEADPNVGTADYTSLVYLPDSSTSPSAPATRTPNVWQQYDASTTGSRWYATGATGTAIGCTQATPCSFADLKTRLPNAVVSLSLGFSKGRDNPFVGAVDGLQVNNTVYDFEFSGVRTRLAR